jgi:hypothetical protein
MNRRKPALDAFAVTFEGRLFQPINDTRQRQLHRARRTVPLSER